MRYRKLRIAWSAIFGVMAAVLALCWSLGYRTDGVKDFGRFSLIADLGTVAIGIPAKPGQTTTIHYLVLHDAQGNAHDASVLFRKLIKFRYWWFVVGGSVLAIIPWLRPRFSLRTLLIAMTLVAVGLGVVVWIS